MPKRITNDEFDKILQAVAGFPEGAGLEEINRAMNDELPRRTLQRRVSLLAE